RLPFRREQTPVFQPMQRGIEGALRDLQRVAGNLLESLGDAITVNRTERDNLEDQKIQRALRQIGLGRHALKPRTSTYNSAGGPRSSQPGIGLGSHGDTSSPVTRRKAKRFNGDWKSPGLGGSV